MVKKTVRVYTVSVRTPLTTLRIKQEGEREREKVVVVKTSQDYYNFLFSFSIFLIRPTTQITQFFHKQLKFPIIPNNNITSCFSFGISRICITQLFSHFRFFLKQDVA